MDSPSPNQLSFPHPFAWRPDQTTLPCFLWSLSNVLLGEKWLRQTPWHWEIGQLPGIKPQGDLQTWRRRSQPTSHEVCFLLTVYNGQLSVQHCLGWHTQSLNQTWIQGLSWGSITDLLASVVYLSKVGHTRQCERMVERPWEQNPIFPRERHLSCAQLPWLLQRLHLLLVPDVWKNSGPDMLVVRFSNQHPYQTGPDLHQHLSQRHHGAVGEAIIASPWAG